MVGGVDGHALGFGEGKLCFGGGGIEWRFEDRSRRRLICGHILLWNRCKRIYIIIKIEK